LRPVFLVLLDRWRWTSFRAFPRDGAYSCNTSRVTPAVHDLDSYDPIPLEVKVSMIRGR
jgi:hypothetical protein